MAEAGALVAVEPLTILARYEQGEMIKDVAKSLGVSDKAVYRLLVNKAPDQWRDYQTAHAIKALEDATQKLETAADALELARAREQVRSAQWQLERLCRRLYGQDAPPASTQAVQININLRGSSATNTAETVVVEHSSQGAKG
jgi:hypothetical protein